MTIPRRSLIALIAWSALIARPAAAQDQTPAPEPPPRLAIGPLGLSPSVTFTNVGVDTNVFNDGVNPKRDFTATVTPLLDVRLRVRALRVTGATSADYVYFRKYASERSINRKDSAQIEMLGSRIHPYVAGQFLDVKERPALEIDKRAQRRDERLNAGVDVRLGPRTVFAFSTERRKTAFGATDVFDGVSLSRSLDRTTTAVVAGLRLELTPLTTFFTNVHVERDRFASSPLRDSNTVRVIPGLQFRPGALLSGKASVGYRRFDSLDVSQPDVSGVVADVAISYTPYGDTKLDASAQRDVGYSFQIEQPVYVSTGETVRLAQRLFGPVDGLASVAYTRLAYRTARSLVSGGFDRAVQVGGGIGFRIGGGRLSINAERVHRDTNLPFQTPYTGARYFSAYIYGF